MDYRSASIDDIPVLSKMNRQLVEDEQHRHRFKPDTWFEERMRCLLTSAYRAVLFEIEDEVVAYALYRDHPDHADTVYVRQFFVNRGYRRQGIGREVMRILRDEIWAKGKRVTVEVLVGNQVARAFYGAVGFRPYSIELEVPASDESPGEQR